MQTGKLSRAGRAAEVVRLELQRPDPPEMLNDEEAAVWRRIADARPTNWFTDDTLDLLTNYCRHIVQQRDIAAEIEKMREAGEQTLSRYRQLIQLDIKMTAIIGSLATKMRLTHQSTYDKTAKAGRKLVPAQKPWED